MTASPRQWDIVKVRINPDDRDEHPAVIVSPDELCADERKSKLNVLYGSTRRPAQTVRPFEVVLNGADGLERPTVFNCVYFYGVDRRKFTANLGRVSRERRRQIGRTVVASYRFPL
jgi:mRNA-degrading endonuclease toxin of MazEF toxin-antitoxin module